MDYGGGPVSFPYACGGAMSGGGGKERRRPIRQEARRKRILLLAAGGPGNGGRIRPEDSIKVGILHSLSGTMAISETSVRDAELLAIKEINENGGVLGKQLVPVIEDGASDNAVLRRRRRSFF